MFESFNTKHNIQKKLNLPVRKSKKTYFVALVSVTCR